MKISILTATYNSEKTLRDTIESVLRQSYREFEYIIIDGGSKDCTLDVIKEYEPQFEGRLKYISEPDNGIYDAMNKGIRMATGDVVGILNSDDFYTSDDALQKIADAFEHNDIDATYGDIHFVNDDDLTKMVRYYSSAVFKRLFMRFGLSKRAPKFSEQTAFRFRNLKRKVIIVRCSPSKRNLLSLAAMAKLSMCICN